MKGRGLARNAAREILVNLQQISHSPPDGMCVSWIEEQEVHERIRALQTRTRDVGFGLVFFVFLTKLERQTDNLEKLKSVGGHTNRKKKGEVGLFHLLSCVCSPPSCPSTLGKVKSGSEPEC